MSYRIKYPLAHHSPAKQELIVIEFARRHIDSGNIREMLDDVLLPLAESREHAENFEGRMTFYFSGWDDDPRETADIPELRAWFSDLTAEFPYWFHFAEKQGDTLFHVLRLLCRGHYVKGDQPGLVGWRFDDMEQFLATVQTLFGYMSGLYRQLGLPEAMDRRVSEEVAQLIEGAME